MNPLKLLADKLRGKRRYRFRPAVTGRWVTEAFAKAHPRETVRVRWPAPGVYREDQL